MGNKILSNDIYKFYLSFQESNTMSESTKNDLDYLDSINITYHSIRNDLYRNDNNEIKKKPLSSTIPPYKDAHLETCRNDNLNGTIIFLGEVYNLIGIDIDNKGDTLEIYEEFFIENQLESTLTIKTVNDGFHYYYRLDDNQRDILKKIGFNSKNDAILGKKIDIKYTNQVFFGPSHFNFEGDTLKYEIIDYTEPALLPHILFTELLKNYQCSKCKNTITESDLKKTSTKTNILCTKCRDSNKTNAKKKSKTSIPDFDSNGEDKPDNNSSNRNNVSLICRYLDCLKDERFDKYESWFIIGAIIHNECNDFDVFCKYSAKSPKYDKAECVKKWSEYGKSGVDKVTKATLIKMAFEDNPKMCIDAKKYDIDSLVYKVLTNGHNDDLLAIIFYLDKQESLLFNEQEDPLGWYVLNEYNYWQKQITIYSITALITKSLTNILSSSMRYYRVKLASDDKMMKLMNTNYSRSIQYCSMMKSKKNIEESLREYYKVYNFSDLKDNINDNIFAFKNGVYDLVSNEFRLAKPSEYVTNYTNYDYKEEKDVSKDIMDKIKTMLKEIHEPNKKKTNEDYGPTTKYMLFTIAQCLSGKQYLEKFYVWTGRGRNGKGLECELIKGTFDSSCYFYNLDVGYLQNTTRRDANAPDEIICNMRNSRISFSTEPEGNVEMNTEKLLRISGLDTVNGRRLREHLNKNGFIPKNKIFIQTNFELSFSGTSSPSSLKSLTERLEVLEHQYSFVDDPTEDYEKKIDVKLKNEIKSNAEYKIAFFHILLRFYKKYARNGFTIEMPNSVKKTSTEYLVSSNPFQSFYESHVKKLTSEEIKERKKNKEKCYVRTVDLYRDYSKYCKSKELTPESSRQFMSQMKSKGHKPFKTSIMVYNNIIYIDAIVDNFVELEEEDEEDENEEEDEELEPKHPPSISRSNNNVTSVRTTKKTSYSKEPPKDEEEEEKSEQKHPPPMSRLPKQVKSNNNVTPVRTTTKTSHSKEIPKTTPKVLPKVTPKTIPKKKAIIKIESDSEYDQDSSEESSSHDDSKNDNDDNDDTESDSNPSVTTPVSRFISNKTFSIYDE